jgi:hypothetical protein
MDTSKHRKLKLVKGFLIHFFQRFASVYGLNTLFSILIAYRSSKIIFVEFLFNKSNIQFAASIAGLSASNRYLQLIFDGLKTRSLIPMISGGLSSLFLLIDRDNKRSAMIANLLVVRSLFFTVRAFTYEKPVGVHDDHYNLKIRPSKHLMVVRLRKFIDSVGHLFIWSSISTIFSYSCFTSPTYFSVVILITKKSFFKSLLSISASYKRLGKNCYKHVLGTANLNHFLKKQLIPHDIEMVRDGTTSLEHLRLFKKIGDGNLQEIIQDIKDLEHLLPPGIKHKRFMCAVQHPGQSGCADAAIQVGIEVFKGMIKTYFTLNLVVLS